MEEGATDTLPLVAVILKTAKLDVLADALDAQLADSPDFFEQEPVVIDLSPHRRRLTPHGRGQVGRARRRRRGQHGQRCLERMG